MQEDLLAQDMPTGAARRPDPTPVCGVSRRGEVSSSEARVPAAGAAFRGATRGNSQRETQPLGAAQFLQHEPESTRCMSSPSTYS